MATTVDTNYTTDDDPLDDPLVNPERGFFCNTIPDPDKKHYHTLMPAYLYLGEVCGVNLAWDGLTAETTSQVLKEFAQEKLEPARAAGAKVVFRPRYDTEGPNSPSMCGVFHADTIEIQKNHIDAIAKMLAEHKDVVAFIQAGYLGKWGEWNTEDFPHSTAPFLYDDATRAKIIDHVLSKYKEHEIKQDVELRRPVFAKEVIDRAAANGETKPNVGLHSDCFMSSNSDVGTYSDFENIEANFHSVEAAKAYARDLTKDASFGGETCNHGGGERWRDCNQMRIEPRELHLTYLNGDFSQFAIEAWTNGGCFGEIRSAIGYRFEVKCVEYTANVVPGGSFTVVIDIQNTGWAKLHKPRTAEVVLRSSSTPTPERYTPSNSATAEWAPAPDTMTSPTTTRLELTDTAPMTAGTYSVRLAIPDPDAPTHLPEDSRTRISYAVKLASKRNGKRVFDENTGENDLGVTIRVQ
jgi:hypothetical protein